VYPWSASEGEPSLPLEVEWNVLEPVRLAHLDAGVAAAAARWPSIGARLAEQAVHRTDNLANQLAILCLPGLELRLYALLSHLADRFGHVQPKGAVVPIRLTHETLARLVGSRRPSVTTSLSRLRRQRLLGVCDDGRWIVGRPSPTTRDELSAGSRAPSAGRPTAGRTNCGAETAAAPIASNSSRTTTGN